MSHKVEKTIGGKLLTIETGRVALQANASVTVRYGDTMLLVTVCVSTQQRADADFVPLTVDYEERLYAAGKIPGSFFRREGRPSQEAVLASRLADRALRPLFPKSYRNDVQIVATVLSADMENPPEVPALVGAAAAVALSGLPFNGPVSAVRVGYVGGQFIINPTFKELNGSPLNLVVAGTRQAIVMVEAGASEVSEEVVVEGIRAGQQANQQVIEAMEELARLWPSPASPSSQTPLRRS